MTKSLVKITGLRKAFPGVLALDGVNFDLQEGEVHAVVGKNGAGKSTLISIMSGASQADSGVLEFDGEVMNIADLHGLPIATVYQESAVFPNLSVAQNIFAGREASLGQGRKGRAAARARVIELLTKFRLRCKPEDLVATLSPVEHKVIAIIRAVLLSSRILILDEPTAVLSVTDTGRLFELLREMRTTELSVIYISHRLEEIFQIADRVTVLRDGRVTYSGDLVSMDLAQLVGEIVGSESQVGTAASTEEIKLRVEQGEPPRFEARSISHADGRFENVSIAVQRGEIVGLAGLVGAGKTEIGKAIFGAEALRFGELYLDGTRITVDSPASAIRQGIIYVTEDRKHEGLFGDMTIAANICAPILRRLSGRLGLLNQPAMASLVQRALLTYRVKATGINQIVATLSGGNQQKVLLARWLQLAPRVLIVDEPTVGVDVSAREEIYRLIRSIAKGGAAVIFASSDLNELLDNTDRILTLNKGRLNGSYSAASASEQKLLEAVSGLAVQ